MIVDLETIGREGEPSVTLAFAETVASGADVAFAQPVRGEIRLTRSGAVVWVQGDVATAVTLTCGRCLRAFAHTLQGRFAEGFRPGASAEVEAAGGGRGDLVLALEGTALDLGEVVRQHLLIALPLVPLCRPGCRGLCPTCGADRDEGSCACRPDDGDPRLAALREFRPASG